MRNFLFFLNFVNNCNQNVHFFWKSMCFGKILVGGVEFGCGCYLRLLFAIVLLGGMIVVRGNTINCQGRCRQRPYGPEFDL